jgi:hypothetical protein
MRRISTSWITEHTCWVIYCKLDVCRLRYVNILCTIDVYSSAWRWKEPFHWLQKFSCDARLSWWPVSIDFSIRIVLLNPFFYKDRCTFESIDQLSFVLFLYLRKSFYSLSPLFFKINLFRFGNLNKFLSTRKSSWQRVLIDYKSKLGLC